MRCLGGSLVTEVSDPGAAARQSSFADALRVRLLQAKLMVNHPQDEYEQEADRVADRVMRIPDAATHATLRSARLVQRKCHKCEEELKRRRCCNIPGTPRSPSRLSMPRRNVNRRTLGARQCIARSSVLVHGAAVQD